MTGLFNLTRGVGWACALGLIVLSHAGCGGGGSSGGGGGPAPATVGPAGGVVNLANGVTVSVPAGAVSSPVTFSARTGPGIDPASLPISGMVLAGQPFQLEPAGLRFAKPVEVTIPFQAGSGFTAKDLLGAHREDTTGVVDLVPPNGETAGTVTLLLSHFSTVQAVRSSAAPPGVTSVDPAIARVGSQSVTVFGSGFKAGPGLQVFFGGVAAVSTSVQFVSPSEIRAVASVAIAGSVDVRVKNGDGISHSLKDGYTAVDALTLQAVQPDSSPAGSVATVRLAGAGFFGTTSVTVGGLPATNVQVVSQSALDCEFPDDLAGAKDVVVTTPDGATASLIAGFRRTPSLSGISPPAGPLGGTPVTVTGFGFTAGVTILVDGQPLPGQALASSTTITGTMPPTSAPKRVTIQAASPVGSGPTALAFDYGLAVSSLAPGGGPTAGGNGITVNGTGFTSGTTFRLAGVQIPGSVQSSTTFLGTAPAGSPGAADLQVNAPHGSAALTGAYYYGAPSTLAVVPNEVLLNVDTGITVRGAGFYDGITGTVGGQALADLTVVDSSTLVAVTRQPTAGAQDVVLTTLGGTDTLLSGVTGVAQAPAPWESLGTGLDGASTVFTRDALAAGAPETFFVATVGGLFRSRNGGLSWKRVTPAAAANPLTFGVTVSPANTQVVYADVGNEVFKSVDEGDSWTLVYGQPGNLTSHPTDPDIAFVVGTSSAVRTLNGGASWIGFGPSGVNSALAISPTNPQRMVMSAGFSGALAGWSADGGTTWTVVNTNLSDHRASAFDPLDSSVVWLGGDQGLERSNDGGATWTVVSGAPGQARDLVIAPSTPRRIYIALHGRLGEEVLVSEDAGANWAPVATGLEGQFPLALLVDPNDHDTLFAGLGRSGGVAKTTDAGGRWSPAQAGLDAANPTALAVVPSPSRHMYAYMGGYPRYSLNGGLTWLKADQPPPADQLSDPWIGYQRQTVVDPGNPLVAYLTGTSVYKTSDGGRTWADLGTLPTATWIRDIAIDPLGSLYVGYSGTDSMGFLENRVIKSVDGGASWAFVDTGLYLGSGDFHIRLAPSSPNTLYCFKRSTNRIYRSTDAAATWSRLSNRNNNQGVNVQDVAVDSSDPDTVYSLQNQKLYRSQDAGATWTLLPAPAWSGGAQLVLEAGANAPIYVIDHSEQIFKSKDGGMTWTNLLPTNPTSAFTDSTWIVHDPSRPGTIYLNPSYSRSLLKSTTGGE